MSTRVLILEDDEGVRSALRLALASCGYLVTFAKGVHDLLALLDQSSLPCVVFVDPLTPDLPFEMILQRAQRRRIPVAVLPVGAAGVEKGMGVPKRRLENPEIVLRLVRSSQQDKSRRLAHTGSKVRLRRPR